MAPSDPALDDFMTVAEVATILKLDLQTVRNWVDDENLPVVRIGRRVRIEALDFDALVNASYCGKATAAPTKGIWGVRSHH